MAHFIEEEINKGDSADAEVYTSTTAKNWKIDFLFFNERFKILRKYID